MKKTIALDLVVSAVILTFIFFGFNVTLSLARETTGSPAILSDVMGEVLVLKGEATKWVPATAGMSLNSGDSVTTGPSSTVTLTYFDGSQTMVFPDTGLKISEMSGGQDEGTKVIQIEQWLGRTYNRVERLLDIESRFEIETPNAVTSVRGTGFGVLHENGTTQVDVVEGTVEVTGQRNTVQVKTDQTTSVQFGEEPIPVAPRQIEGNPYDEVNEYLESTKPEDRNENDSGSDAGEGNGGSNETEENPEVDSVIREEDEIKNDNSGDSTIRDLNDGDTNDKECKNPNEGKDGDNGDCNAGKDNDDKIKQEEKKEEKKKEEKKKEEKKKEEKKEEKKKEEKKKEEKKEEKKKEK